MPSDAEIDTLLALGEARLPHQPVTREAIAAKLTAVLDEATPIEDLHGADLYLACALASGDAAALAVAEHELLPGVRAAAGKVDPNPTFVEEVAQRVRSKLLVGHGGAPGIAGYRGTGPLAGWMRVIATRVAIDVKRETTRHAAAAPDALDHLPAPDDPELAVIWQGAAAEYKRALAIAFDGLDKRERTLLRQRYLDGLDTATLARLYHVNPTTTFRWIRQIERQLASTTRAILIEKLAVSESQLHSMERMIASQLQLSLDRMLRKRG